MSRLGVARLVGLAAVLSIAIVGVSVAIAAGTHHAAKYTKAATATRWVHARTARAAAGAYAYVSATGHIAGGKFAAGTLRCPGSNPHAIGGFFDSNKVNVFESTDRLGKASSQWVVGLTNAGSATANVIIGAVCAR
jgi:hypothetical protein